VVSLFNAFIKAQLNQLPPLGGSLTKKEDSVMSSRIFLFLVAALFVTLTTTTNAYADEPTSLSADSTNTSTAPENSNEASDATAGDGVADDSTNDAIADNNDSDAAPPNPEDLSNMEGNATKQDVHDTLELIVKLRGDLSALTERLGSDFVTTETFEKAFATYKRQSKSRGNRLHVNVNGGGGVGEPVNDTYNTFTGGLEWNYITSSYVGGGASFELGCASTHGECPFVGKAVAQFTTVIPTGDSGSVQINVGPGLLFGMGPQEGGPYNFPFARVGARYSFGKSQLVSVGLNLEVPLVSKDDLVDASLGKVALNGQLSFLLPSWD
jgi:hypothetical protein